MMELNLTRLDYLQVCKAILASMDTSTARLSKVFWGITFIYFLLSRLELRLPKQWSYCLVEENGLHRRWKIDQEIRSFLSIDNFTT